MILRHSLPMSTRYEYFDLLSKMVQGPYLGSYIIWVLFVLMAWSFSLIIVFSVSFLEIGVTGTLSITKFLALNWHFSQDLQNLSISRLILGHTKDNLILSLVFSSPRCHPNGSS